jgi:hypothetical protein
MEFIGTLTEIRSIVDDLTDANYHVIITRVKKQSLNQVHLLIRRNLLPGETFEEGKERIKELLGFTYFEDEELKYRSFKHLTKNEYELLVQYLRGL